MISTVIIHSLCKDIPNRSIVLSWGEILQNKSVSTCQTIIILLDNTEHSTTPLQQQQKVGFELVIFSLFGWEELNRDEFKSALWYRITKRRTASITKNWFQFGRGRDRSSHPNHMFPQEENLATLRELWQRRCVALEEPRIFWSHFGKTHLHHTFRFLFSAVLVLHKGTRLQSFKTCLAGKANP